MTTAKIADGTILTGDLSAASFGAWTRTNVAADARTALGIADPDGFLLKANNLSDLNNAGTARTNLGLLALATRNTVATAHIDDLAVTTAKLADNSVTSAKIVDGTVATVDIANLAITTGKIADGAVTSAKIADGTIVTADLADNSVTSAKIVDGTVATVDITNLAITTGKIADSAVTTAKIADDTINLADINKTVATGGLAEWVTTTDAQTAREKLGIETGYFEVDNDLNELNTAQKKLDARTNLDVYAKADVYTRTQLNTSAGTGQVHWDRVTNKPDFDGSGVFASKYMYLTSSDVQHWRYTLTSDHVGALVYVSQANAGTTETYIDLPDPASLRRNSRIVVYPSKYTADRRIIVRNPHGAFANRETGAGWLVHAFRTQAGTRSDCAVLQLTVVRGQNQEMTWMAYDISNTEWEGLHSTDPGYSNVGEVQQTTPVLADGPSSSFFTFAVTVSVRNAGTGTLTGGGTKYFFEPGNYGTVTANPNPTFVFDRWTGDASGSANPLTINNVTNDMKIEAVFVSE